MHTGMLWFDNSKCELEYWREQHYDNLIRATCTADVLHWFGKV